MIGHSTECAECGHLGIHHVAQAAGTRCEWDECKCSGMVIGLTPRECEILKLFAAGNTVKSVGALLNLSTKTVEAHRYNMGVKTGAHKTIDLILLALRTGLVELKDLPAPGARIEMHAA